MRHTIRHSMVAVVAGIGLAVGYAQPVHSFPITYNAVAEQLMAITEGDFFNQSFEITNNTGVTWTDWHITIEGLEGRGTATGSFGFIDVAGGGHDGTAYDGPGSYTVDNVAGKLLDVVGLSIPNGGVYTFTIDTDDFESLGAYHIFGTPTTDGDGDGDGRIPEPATLVLFAVGLAGLVFMTRRQGRAI